MSRAYRIELTRRARKDIDSLDNPVRQRIERAIAELAEDPRPRGCVKLTGHEDCWRVRVGHYRVVYTVQDDALVVLVLAAGPRSDIYRRFE